MGASHHHINIRPSGRLRKGEGWGRVGKLAAKRGEYIYKEDEEEI